MASPVRMPVEAAGALNWLAALVHARIRGIQADEIMRVEHVVPVGDNALAVYCKDSRPPTTKAVRTMFLQLHSLSNFTGSSSHC